MVLFHHLQISYVLKTEGFVLCSFFFLTSKLGWANDAIHPISLLSPHCPLQFSPTSLSSERYGLTQEWKLVQNSPCPTTICLVSLFPGNKVSLTSLQFPGPPSCSLMKLGVTLGFLQLLGTSFDFYDLLKKVESSLTLPLPSLWAPWIYSALSHRLRYVEISQEIPDLILLCYC